MDESNTGMKVCPYCAELIQTAALKCRYCGETLAATTVGLAEKKESNEGTSAKWKRHSYGVIIATAIAVLLIIGISACASVLLAQRNSTIHANISRFQDERRKELFDNDYPKEPKGHYDPTKPIPPNATALQRIPITLNPVEVQMYEAEVEKVKQVRAEIVARYDALIIHERQSFTVTVVSVCIITASLIIAVLILYAFYLRVFAFLHNMKTTT